MLKLFLFLDSIENTEASSIESDTDDDSYVKPNDLKLLAEEKGYCELHKNSDPLSEDSQGYLISSSKIFEKTCNSQKTEVIILQETKSRNDTGIDFFLK